MRGYNLSNFKNGKAFIHFDGIKNDKADYGARICINTKGEKLYELPDRDMIVNEFQDEDVAFVMGKDGKYAMMNNQGEFLTEFVYDHIYGGSEEGLFEANCNGKHGHIDINGREIIPCMYDKGHYFLEGVASESLNGKWGMVDYFNNTVIPFEYDEIFASKNNLISAKKNGKWGLINKNNEIVADFLYDDIYHYCSRECFVYPAKQGDKWGLIDRYGNIVEDFIYDAIEDISDAEDIAGEILWIKKDKKRALYSPRTKKFITDFDYTYFGYLSEGRILAHKNGYVGFLDCNGDEIIPFIFDGNCPLDDDFSEGLCVVYKDDKAGMIDAEGNVIIPFEYKKLSDCQEGMICTENKKNELGFFNRKGEIAIPFGKYSCHYSNFQDGYAVVYDEEQGNVYIDKTGKILEIKI